MRLPNRKPGKFTFTKADPHLTQAKVDELNAQLEKIIKHTRPQAIKDVKRYAENGDFSENAEYQIAKGRLRGLNLVIDKIKDQLKDVKLIKPSKACKAIEIGHRVTIEFSGKEICFQILGPAETNPQAGIISYKSPIGAALLGKKVGATIKIPDREAEYKILKIEV